MTFHVVWFFLNLFFIHMLPFSFSFRSVGHIPRFLRYSNKYYIDKRFGVRLFSSSLSVESDVKKWLRDRLPIAQLNSSEAICELNVLNETLCYHDRKYYVDGAAEIPDGLYDRILRRAVDISGKFPDLKHLVTRLSAVGALGGSNNNYPHDPPMLSLNNAFSKEEVQKFTEKCQINSLSEQQDFAESFLVEPKIDGLSLSLKYCNGSLISMGTRGNGKLGENLSLPLDSTDIIGIPTSIPTDRDVEVRGEIYMSRPAFDVINMDRRSKNLSEFANPRNAAAGILRKSQREKGLSFFAYYLRPLDGNSPLTMTNQEQTLEYLQSLGFQCAVPYFHCHSLSSVLDAINAIEMSRTGMNYDIDGAVVKVNSFEIQRKLGCTSKYPRWAVAYKYGAKDAVTQVLDIVVQVGRTGVLTPVANLAPVEVGGVTIERATLHNEDEVNRLGVTIGTMVRVARSGDVIPKIIEVVDKTIHNVDEKSLYHLPSTCPVCGSVTAVDEGGKIVRCTGGLTCSAQAIESIGHFCSKDALDIQGLGPAKIEELYNDKIIQSVVDIFTLRDRDRNSTTPFLRGRAGWGDKMVANLLNAIDLRRQIPMSRLLYGLGIRGVGQRTAEDLARHFKHFDSFWNFVCHSENQSNLPNLYNMGSKSWQAIFAFASSPQNQQLISDLQNQLEILSIEDVRSLNSYSSRKLFNESELLTTDSQSTTSNSSTTTVLKDRIIALSGSFQSGSKSQFEHIIQALGGKVTQSFTRDTNLLIVAQKVGSTSKMKKAIEKNIEIWDEDEWLTFLASHNQP